MIDQERVIDTGHLIKIIKLNKMLTTLPLSKRKTLNSKCYFLRINAEQDHLFCDAIINIEVKGGFCFDVTGEGEGGRSVCGAHPS